jgi:hypothetical protein
MAEQHPKIPITRRSALRMALPWLMALRGASTRALTFQFFGAARKLAAAGVGAGVGALASPQAQGLASFPVTAAETKAGLAPIAAQQYPTGNALRYGILANNSEAASANSAVLAKIFNAITGLSGLITFPNSTGMDIYYFSGIAYQCMPGTSVDLMGSTLSFSKTYDPRTDDTHGFIEAIRDFELRNGNITVDYAGSGPNNPGPVLRLGSRHGYPFGIYSSGVLDQDHLVAKGQPPMGGFHIHDLGLITNNPAAQVVLMLGGLHDVLFENIFVDGQNRAVTGLYYEFGFSSTNGHESNPSEWTSSHADNMRFKNIRVQNLKTGGTSAGIGVRGAHEVSVEGLHVDTADVIFECNPGEALFYRTWSNGRAETKCICRLKNVSGLNLASVGLNLSGATPASASYLRTVISGLGHPADYAAQSDLIEFEVDGFEIRAAAGIAVSGRAQIRNGSISGGAGTGGIVWMDEATFVEIDNVEVLNSGGIGIRATFGSAIWSPVRKKSGAIRDCKIAGNKGPGIALDNCDGVVIERNQLGFNAERDGTTESTQASGVSLGPNAFHVTCSQNRTTCSPGSSAYNSTNSAANAMNRITEEGITRTVSGSGHFITDF